VKLRGVMLGAVEIASPKPAPELQSVVRALSC